MTELRYKRGLYEAISNNRKVSLTKSYGLYYISVLDLTTNRLDQATYKTLRGVNKWLEKYDCFITM